MSYPGVAHSENETYGIELELILKYLPGDLEETRQFGAFSRLQEVAHQELWRLFNVATIPVNVLNAERNYNRWTIDEDGSIDPTSFDPSITEIWYKVGHDRNSKLGATGVEIKSPIFNVGDDASYAQIRHVIALVLEHFTVMTNYSTGMHVHVGRGSQGYSLPILRNITQLMLTFEHQIETIHPDHRIRNVWCKALSTLEGIDSSKDPWSAVRKVKELENMEHFVFLLGCDKLQAYNFVNLSRGMPMRTIEFRQHTGTIDADRVMAWIRFTTGVLHLMRAMGMPELVEYYKSRLYVRQGQRIVEERPGTPPHLRKMIETID